MQRPTSRITLLENFISIWSKRTCRQERLIYRQHRSRLNRKHYESQWFWQAPLLDLDQIRQGEFSIYRQWQPTETSRSLMLLESPFQNFLSHPETFATLQQTSKDDEESVGWDLKIVGQKGLGIVSKTVFTYPLLCTMSLASLIATCTFPVFLRSF